MKRNSPSAFRLRIRTKTHKLRRCSGRSTETLSAILGPRNCRSCVTSRAWLQPALRHRTLLKPIRMPQSHEHCIIFRDDSVAMERRFEDPQAIIEAHDADGFFRGAGVGRSGTAAGQVAGRIFFLRGGLSAGTEAAASCCPTGGGPRLICLGVFDGAGRVSPADPRGHPPSRPTVRSLMPARRGVSTTMSPFRAPAPASAAGRLLPGQFDFPFPRGWIATADAAFEKLAARQPVNMARSVSLGGPMILSRSPELFFEIDGDGWIEAHPMKGTAPAARPRPRTPG